MVAQYLTSGRGAAAIAVSIERAVASGDLPPGHALPAIRDLAATLGVNPNTVAAAYRSLRERGIVETSGRRGSRIRPRPASTHRSATLSIPPGTRNAASGMPNPALLPEVRRTFLDAIAARPARRGEATVSPALATAAISRLRADAVPVGDEVAVLSGALDAIDRVLTVHLKVGDAVLVEDPAWSELLDLIAALGLAPVPMEVDQDGPLPDSVARAAQRGARAVIVTTRAHNPTGAAVTRHRARELRPLLSAFSLLIEDDHGAELAGVPLYSLCGATAHWAHVRSVSKAYGPDLRVAVLAGDTTTIDRVRGRQRLGPGWVSHLLQDTVVALWEDEDAARRVDLARETYAARRKALINALGGHGVPAYGKTGLNVWIPVRDETSAVATLLAAGWAVAPGARFRLASPPAIRVTIAELSEEDVPVLADAIAQAVSLRRVTAMPTR